jgi:hypothetical protein
MLTVRSSTNSGTTIKVHLLANRLSVPSRSPGFFVSFFFEKFLVVVVQDTSVKEDKMTSDGVCKFLQDLHFKLDDKIVLILAWKLKAQVQGEFTKEEFYNGMNEMGYVRRLSLDLLIGWIT